MATQSGTLRRFLDAIARTYWRFITKYTSLIRSVGLGISTITKGKEGAKVLFVDSWKVALARCGVHILPAAVSIVLVAVNLVGFFIGAELQGPGDQDDIKLGALQICAKVQELLVVASLSMVVFHVLRNELVFGSGLPLGLVGAGFSFTSLSFFWSSDFWGAVSYKHPSPWRKLGIITLLVAAGILAVLAGPTSAVLMIPRELDWASGGGIFWLNGTKEEMWPSTLDETTLQAHDCTASKWLDDPSCIANGYRAIYHNFENWKMGPQNGITSFELQDRHLRKNVHARVRTPGNVEVETWVFTTFAPAAIMQSVVYNLWNIALGFLKAHAPNSHPLPNLLGYASRRTMSLQTEVPAVRVVCSDELKTIEDTGAVFLYFPALPEFRMRWNVSDDTFWQYFQGIDVTQSVQEKLTSGVASAALTSSAIIATSVDLQVGEGQSSTIGVVLMSPPAANATAWTMQPCSVDARWAKGTSLIEEDARSIPYNMAADQGRSLLESDLRTEEFGWAHFAPPQDGTWRRINMTNGWFRGLAPLLPRSDPGSSNMVNQTSIDSILSLVAMSKLGDPDTTSMMEFALATIVVDGLSRSTSHRTANYTAMVDEVASAQWNKSSARSFIRTGEPRESFRPSNAEQLYEMRMDVFLRGFVMAAVGWFDYFCIVVLLIHALIALGHTFWVVLWSPSTSDVWESLPELLALGLNSEQPHATGADDLVNATTGITTWGPLKQVGWVEAVEDIDTAQTTAKEAGHLKQLQLRFGKGRHLENNGRDAKFAVVPGTAYGIDS